MFILAVKPIEKIQWAEIPNVVQVKWNRKVFLLKHE